VNQDRDKVLDAERILGVKTNASVTEIRERYRFLAHAYHPDKFASESQKKAAEQEFKKIAEAYQTLLKDSESKLDSRNYHSEDETKSAGEAEHRKNASTQKKDTKLGGWSRTWLVISIVWVGICAAFCYLMINDIGVAYVSKAEQLVIFDQTRKPVGIFEASIEESDKQIMDTTIEMTFENVQPKVRAESFVFRVQSSTEDSVIVEFIDRFADKQQHFALEKQQKRIIAYIRNGILSALGLPLLLLLVGKTIAWIVSGFRRN
jgi:hypothetical protein